MANSFSYDGTDMSGASYGLTVLPYDEPWMPQPILDKRRPTRGSAEFHGVNFQEGVINLKCLVTGTSKSDLHTKLDAIALKLNPTLLLKKIGLDEITDRYWYGILVSPISSAPRGDRHSRFSLRFVTRGAAYSTTEDDSTFTLLTDPDTFNVDSGGAIGGTALTYPVWYIRNTTGGSVSDKLILNNTTRGESIAWRGALANNKWLRFGGTLSNDGRFLYSIRTSNGTDADATAETYTQAIGGYVSGDWVRLDPSVQNTITFTGLSSGTVRWVYRDRFI